MNWTIFATLGAQIQPPLLNAAQGVTNTFLSAIQTPLLAALTAYVAFTGYQMFTGHMAEPLRDVWVRIAKGAFVVFLLSSSGYLTYVSNLFMHGIPNDIANALGNTGNISAGIFDHIWNIAFKGGLEVWKGTSIWDVALELLIILYWFAALIACVLGFVIWQSAELLLGLFVAVGPLVVPMFLFQATRPVFERWVGALLSMIFLQIMVVILLVVLTSAENALLGGLQSTANVIAEIQGLFAPIILFCLAALLVWQMPSAAVALAGGMHFHAYALHRATLGKAADTAKAIASRSGGAIAQGARSGVNALTGRPLSVSGGSPP